MPQRIQQPYYNPHQIDGGKYTSGFEYASSDGTPYSGPYHKLPNGQLFTGFRPEPTSVELFDIRFKTSDDVIRYNGIKQADVSRYITPYPYYPSPTLDDYKRGSFQRFFIQKRTSPINTIMEIDYGQFNGINTINNPGINGVIYNQLLVDWKISKIPNSDAAYINGMTIQTAEVSFPGISAYISNLLEFFR